MFLYNCKVFGLRGYDEHRSLSPDQFVFTNEDGYEKVTFYGRTSKNTPGGIKGRKVRLKVVEHYADSTNERCVVTLSKKFLSLIPKDSTS